MNLTLTERLESLPLELELSFFLVLSLTYACRKAKLVVVMVVERGLSCDLGFFLSDQIGELEVKQRIKVS